MSTHPISIQFVAPIADFHSSLWRHHILVSAEYGDPFVEGDNRRVICTLAGHHKMHASLMPREGDYFILINKEVRGKLGLEEGDEVEVSLEKDLSEHGMPMPEELQVMLDQDLEAAEVFDQLTPGKKRSLIYLVTKVKSVPSRINKALAIVDHLKTCGGVLDFKVLNELIKYYNRRNDPRKR
ncbi:MAG: YdeI/OmpD-associated family protein [Bacteroidota bacterium]